MMLRPKAEVRTYDKGMTYELWFGPWLLTGGTGRDRLQDLADDINQKGAR